MESYQTPVAHTAGSSLKPTFHGVEARSKRGGRTLRILDLNSWQMRMDTSCSGRFIPEEWSFGKHWKGVWVHRRSSLDVAVKRGILASVGNRNPCLPACSQSIYRLSSQFKITGFLGFVHRLTFYNTQHFRNDSVSVIRLNEVACSV